MLPRLALLLLIASASAIASADPAPRARTCKPAGGVIFEVDQRVAPKTKVSTSASQLFNNGAWQTVVIDREGGVARTIRGCLEPAQLDAIRDDLETATWATTRAKTPCGSASRRFTVYKSKGKLVFTQRTCSPDVLEAESRLVLDRIEALLAVPYDLDNELRRGGDGSLKSRCQDNPLARGCS